jgi:hypothetical protein
MNMNFTSTVLMMTLAGVVLTLVPFSDQQTTILPFVVDKKFKGNCSSQQQREIVLQAIEDKIISSPALLSLEKVEQCGAGLWIQIANLNMTDPLQRCPSAWREIVTKGVRVCGRPSASHNMCHSTSYSSAGLTYTKVCGRVTGYQVGHPDAFHSSDSINESYVEGVSITHGSPRSHIWTLAAGLSETVAHTRGR